MISKLLVKLSVALTIDDVDLSAITEHTSLASGNLCSDCGRDETDMKVAVPSLGIGGIYHEATNLIFALSILRVLMDDQLMARFGDLSNLKVNFS